MRFAFIRAEDEMKTFPIAAMCRVLSVSTSGYYAWLHREPSERSKRNAELTAKVQATHDASRRTYGSPRVTKKLKKSGEPVSEKTAPPARVVAYFTGSTSQKMLFVASRGLSRPEGRL